MCYSCKLIISESLQSLLKFQAKAAQNVGIDVIIVIAVVNTVRSYFKIYLFHKFLHYRLLLFLSWFLFTL